MPQLNPHDSLQAILLQKVGFEIVSQSLGGNQARYFGRVRPSHMPAWLAAMRELLVNENKAQWSIDLSRQYFLRADKLFFGWRVIIQGQDIQGALTQIVSIIQQVQAARAQVDEVPLHAPPNRNALRNGRGAQPTISAVVGPMAKVQLGM
jgi:hypothetical protein